VNGYSFYHEVLFFPPWWKETFSVVERKEPRGGKNKHPHIKNLSSGRKNNKSAWEKS